MGTTICASRALTASIWLKTAQRGLSVQFLGVASPTAFYSMGPEESWIVAIVADGRNARMKDMLSVLQSVRNAELVEGRDISIGVVRTLPSCQFLCNLFHTLTQMTQGCSCNAPLTAWRKRTRKQMEADTWQLAMEEERARNSQPQTTLDMLPS